MLFVVFSIQHFRLAEDSDKPESLFRFALISFQLLVLNV